MTHLSLLWLYIPILIGIIALVVVGYKALYKVSVNRALSGSKRIALIEPLPFIQMTILVVCLIMMFVMNTKINELQTQVLQLQSDSSTLRQRVDVANASILSLQQQWSEYQLTQGRVRSSQYILTAYNPTLNEISILYSVNLNRLDNNATVSLVAVNQSTLNETISPKVTPSTLNVSLPLTLDSTQKYKFYILVELDDSLEQDYLQEVDFEVVLENQFHYSVGFAGSSSGEGHFDLMVVNRSYGLEDFEIQSVTLSLYLEDILQETISLTSYLIHNQTPLVSELYYESELTNSSYLSMRYVLTITNGFGTHTYTFYGPRHPLA